MKKKIITSLAILALLLPQLVLADGMVIKPYIDRWNYQEEAFQLAFINYEQGIEKMIISIGIEELDSNAVWIFPVPASPEDTVVNVVTKMPQLSGEEITDMAESSLEEIRMGLLATQIYPFPLLFSAGARRIGSVNDIMAPQAGFDWTTEKLYDVEVYEHLEKEGITTEIITAKTAGGLYQYLKDKGLDIKQGQIPVLDNYIGQDYTFVVSWLTLSEIVIQISPAAPESNDDTVSIPNEELYMPKPIEKVQKGIFVAFPTDKIYYPLLPTSVYESEIVPAIIRVFGFVEPEIYSSMETYTEVEYYYDKHFNIDKDLEILYRGPFDNVKYTKIEIQSPSKMLKDDLWIKDKEPAKTFFPLFIGKHPFATGLVIFIKLSILTALLLGLVIYKESRKTIRGFLKVCLLGLFNCLTIGGLIFASIFIRFKEKKQEAIEVINQLKQKGYLWKRRLALILLILDVPFLIFSVFIIIQVLDDLFWYLGDDFKFSRIDHLIAPFIFLIVLPIAALVFLLIIKRIKKEDKALFEKLTQLEYSCWTFLPKDPRRFVFIPVYSILFIVLTLAATYLIETMI